MKARRGEHAGLRTWIEVDMKAIRHNYRAFRRVLGVKTKLLAVVKSNAYGHSLIDFAKTVADCGADWLGVDSLVEGLALRREGVTVPILVLGYTLPDRFSEAAEHSLSLAISSRDSLAKLERFRSKNPLSIHIKIDTGMHRQGFLIEQVPALIAHLKKLPQSVRLEGVFTHLAAKDPAVLRVNKEQLSLFDGVVNSFAAAGCSPLCHASASWGAIVYPEAHYDMVRIGMGLYGHLPSASLKREYGKKFPLRPALSWKTVISEVKDLPDGGGVGYDLTEELPKGARIGICPIGYWHGYPRALSSRGNVLVRGKRARVVGRVSMDMIAIDLSSIKGVIAGDEAVLLGEQGREEISAEEFASWADTSHYEILTRINPLIKRIYC